MGITACVWFLHACHGASNVNMDADLILLVRMVGIVAVTHLLHLVTGADVYFENQPARKVSDKKSLQCIIQPNKEKKITRSFYILPWRWVNTPFTGSKKHKVVFVACVALDHSMLNRCYFYCPLYIISILEIVIFHVGIFLPLMSHRIGNEIVFKQA